MSISEGSMGITRATIETILKDYEQLRLNSARERDERIAKIEASIPGYSDLEAEINSLYIKRSIIRLKPSEDITDTELKNMIQDLSEKKASLLAAGGFSPEDLEQHFSCNECRDTGYTEDGAMCSCFRSRIIEKLYDLSHIRRILDNENFSTFNFDYYDSERTVTKSGQSELDIAHDAVRKARLFVNDFASSDSNLFLCGGTGVGKTFLSNCIARELIDMGNSVVYLSAVRMFDILADSAFDRAEDGDLPARLIYDCDLLIIDDLGTEMTNSFVQTQLFDCINDRILKGRHTIISSNLSVEELQARYSERVFSRVVSNYTIIKLYARDIRIQKALEG